MTAAVAELDLAAPRRARGAIAANPKVLAGGTILVFFLLLTVAQPILEATVWVGRTHLYDPQSGFDSRIAHPSAPALDHWLGTSSLGRDVFSMLAFATRPTLVVAISAAAAIALVSLVLGAVAAVREGWVDGVVTHLSDAMVLLPPCSRSTSWASGGRATSSGRSTSG